MYEANYVHMILYQRELSMHKPQNNPATIIYIPAPGLRVKVYTQLGMALVSLGNRLQEASRIQEPQFQAELSQERS